METAQALSASEAVRSASGLVPELRARAAEAERQRRLDDDLIDLLDKAGMLKLRVPARHGGHEVDMRTLVATIAELGRGDASVAWTTAVWSICSWLASLFPDAVQDEVFDVPGTRICGLLSPTGTAVPQDGGFLFNGRWAFNTGALHSHWNVLIAMAPAPGGDQQWPVMAIAPMSDMSIIDDWHTSGLRATGSVTTVATDLFIPMERVLPLPALLSEQYASEANAGNPIFRTPLLPTACMSVTGTALGLAAAAKEEFLRRAPERKITYTTYERQLEAPITHLQLAEAQMRMDEAAFHAERAAAALDAKSAAGESWTVQERALIRLDASSACELAMRAVEIFSTASGASSIYDSAPIQRIRRDIQAINLHAILHPNTNLELYGRVALGLEPNTVYL
ncbi:acyl-CoA dehydrogenase [Actinomadura sp. KC06]|uniref:acyl-CoA dehydrogenase family protein n=1 Tax=Actinomadura sp. KC06 TaxID=2530369 RepID=UPI0010431FF9|nr:acyl-CoA dehydrogenase family protein [Actinomadura sp. KC06]TDD33886.1 acyl-CoA dehydrogenase [Actinomadura sp. KC06]